MVNDTNLDWEDFKLRHDAAVGYAQSTLKTLTLANGGAIVALLTFIGNVEIEIDSRSIFYAFVWFSVGLSLTILAHGLAYLVQEAYLNAASARMHNSSAQTNQANGRGGALIAFAALCCAGGLSFFIVGSFVALFAIT